jgi:hypothetical protein
MSRSPESVFIDTGAWIALAIVRDPLHTRARPAWEALERRRARLVTSVPVVSPTRPVPDSALETTGCLTRLASRCRCALAAFESLVVDAFSRAGE